MADIPPTNQFITPTDILSDYLKEYPEDILKWTEYFSGRTRRFIGIERPTEIGVVNEDGQIEFPEPEINDPPVRVTPLTIDVVKRIKRNRFSTNPNPPKGICVCCEKPLEDFPICQFSCGHSYHTDCRLAIEYETQENCVVPGCRIRPYSIINSVFREYKELRQLGEDALFSRLQKRKDFRSDLRQLRKLGTAISSGHSKITKLVSQERKKVLELHAERLNMIQHDLNQIGPKVKVSNEFKNYKTTIREGRKFGAAMFRKYHVSIRDMLDYHLIRMNWNTRWTIERNRNYSHFSLYRAGIRMSPGRTKDWKPSNRSKSRGQAQVAIDTDSEDEET
jgi:hypothetical protein